MASKARVEDSKETAEKVGSAETKNLERLEWAIKSRAVTQTTTFRLYKLLSGDNTKTRFSDSQVRILVGFLFSLWRAAFLADRKGTMKARRTDAVELPF